MDFSIKCAYAHGTSALRTHLINMTPRQTELTWPVFAALRKRWAGKVRPVYQCSEAVVAIARAGTIIALHYSAHLAAVRCAAPALG